MRDVAKDCVRDNSQGSSRMTKGSEESTNNSDTTLKKISGEVCAEITNTHRVESGGNADDETEMRREVFSNTLSEEIKNASGETCHVIKEEKIEEPIARKPSGETLESCLNTVKNDRTETGEDGSKSSKDVPTQWKDFTYKQNERKRPGSMSENSQDTCPNEKVEAEIHHKRQRLTVKQEPQNLPSNGQKEVTTADEGESGKPSHETAKDKGM